MTKTHKNIWLSGIIIISLIVIDQIVKVLAMNWLFGSLPKIYFGGFVVFEYAENRGAFLSLGANLSDNQRFWIFVIGVVAILFFCFYTLFQSLKNQYSVVALSLVITGGIGNLIDRVMRGYVIDYVHMGFSGLRTGVFNVADMAISAGVILVMLQQFFVKDGEA